eukprot:1061878-Pelagomonas_calceolata.AAC.1
MHRKSTENVSLEKDSRGSLGCPPGSRKETKETWLEFQQLLIEFGTRQSEPDLSRPTADSALSNLERLERILKSLMLLTLGRRNSTRINKITFDMHPTNPQVDMESTACCDFWLHNIDLVKYKLNNIRIKLETESHRPHSHAPPLLILPEIYKSRMACNYNTQGIRVGMKTPSRFHIIDKAFHRAKLTGLH